MNQFAVPPASRPHGASAITPQEVFSPFPPRLAAIDLDGTLLAPDLTVSAANRDAVARLQGAGLEVVLASGRHHASIQPFAAALPGVRWIISAQGAEVADLARTTVLRREFLSLTEVETVLAIQTQLGIAGMFYTPDAILTDSASNDDLGFYRQLTSLRPQRVTAEVLRRATSHKVVWIGEPEFISGLASDGRIAALGVQTLQTHARLFELMPTSVTKATGLAVLARHLGLGPQEAVVFGDAENDIPMFRWAAGSFAMAHGWPAAKQQARWIAPDGAPASAFARAVEMLSPSLIMASAAG